MRCIFFSPVYQPSDIFVLFVPGLVDVDVVFVDVVDSSFSVVVCVVGKSCSTFDVVEGVVAFVPDVVCVVGGDCLTVNLVGDSVSFSLVVV